MEESLINKHKVCKSCGAISGPRIIRCPECQSEHFGPLTEKETDGLPKMVYELRGPPLLPPSTYDDKEIVISLTNVFVV